MGADVPLYVPSDLCFGFQHLCSLSSMACVRQVRQLSKAVTAETELQITLVELQGLLSPVLRTSLAANTGVAAG